MVVYTISPDLLRNIEKEEGIYFTDILFVFSHKNNAFKAAKDKNGSVIDSYSAIEKNKEIIATWLHLMTCQPSTFEPIDVDLTNITCEETKFMKVCKETKNQNKLILYTQQNLMKHKCLNSIVVFEDTAIKILDRDEAKLELAVVSKKGDTYNLGDTIQNSQVAKGNSQINKSEN
jgi:hypothetical protein